MRARTIVVVAAFAAAATAVVAGGVSHAARPSAQTAVAVKVMPSPRAAVIASEPIFHDHDVVAPTPPPAPTPAPATPRPATPAPRVTRPAPAPPPPLVAYGSIQAIIVAAANAHGVSAQWMLNIAACESGFNPRAVNPAGYYGLFQFSPSTFRANGGTDIWDPVQQSNITATMLAHGQARQWSCA